MPLCCVSDTRVLIVCVRWKHAGKHRPTNIGGHGTAYITVRPWPASPKAALDRSRLSMLFSWGRWGAEDMFVYFYSCVNERFQRLFANLVAVMQIDGAPARWRHRLIGCGRFAIMRGLVGLPLRIKNTRDIANS